MSYAKKRNVKNTKKRVGKNHIKRKQIGGRKNRKQKGGWLDIEKRHRQGRWPFKKRK